MAEIRALALLVAGALALGTAAPAAAAPAPEAAAKPAVSGTFPVDGEPQRIVAGPDGNVWFGVQGNSVGKDLAKITPSGVITYYDLGAITIGTLAVGPDKNLWATINTGVAKIPVASPTTLTPYDIQNFANPQGLTVGPDKNLWAAGGDTLWRVPLSDPTTATPFTITGAGLKQVTATSNRIWAADANGKVHAVKVDGTVTSIDTGGMPQGITAGAGDQVFFTVPDGADTYVGRLKLGGTIQKTTFPNTDPSFQPAFGPDGNYWFGLLLSREAIAVSPTGKVTKAGTFDPPYGARYVAAGPNATMWMALQNPGDTGAIGRVSGLDVDKRATITVKGATATVAKGKAAVRLKCPKSEANGPCQGKVTLKSLTGRKAKLGKKSYSIKAGKTGTVRISLSGATVGQIGRNGLRVQAIVKVRDALGNKKTVKKTIKLVR